MLGGAGGVACPLTEKSGSGGSCASGRWAGGQSSLGGRSGLDSVAPAAPLGCDFLFPPQPRHRLHEVRTGAVLVTE